MKPNKGRRTILKATGGAVLFGSLAGCTDAGDGNGAENGTENGAENGTENGEENGTENGEENGTENGEEENGEEENGEEEEMAMLRVAHLSPDAPNVDVYVDDELTLEDVSFGTVSDYLELEPAAYAIRITAAGDEQTVVFDEEVELTAGAFTAAAIGELADDASQAFAVQTYEDNLEDPGDNARIRVVHASPDAPNVDIAAGGEVLLEDVAFGEAGAVEVPEGEYMIQIRPTGEEEAVAEFPTEVAAGMVYSAFAVGYLAPEEASAEEAPGFDLLLAVDNEGMDSGMENGEENGGENETDES